MFSVIYAMVAVTVQTQQLMLVMTSLNKIYYGMRYCPLFICYLYTGLYLGKYNLNK